jgi:flagella basal body P-ring formation protein FlgA
LRVLNSTRIPRARTLGDPQALDAAEGRQRAAAFRAVSSAQRRSLVRLAAGVGIAAVSAGVFAIAWGHAGDRVRVLALARPVVLGQVLGEGDVKVVELPANSGVAMLPASERGQVVGRPVTASLADGTLLAPVQVGGAAVALGQAQVSVLAKEGHFPPSLAAGDAVSVQDTGSSGSSSAATAAKSGGGAVQATVVDVRPASDSADGAGAVVVTLLCPQDSAAQVAGFDTPALVLLPAQPSGR